MNPLRDSVSAAYEPVSDLGRSVKKRHPYAKEAYSLKLGLEAGVVEIPEVIEWADRILADFEYEDDVANLAMAGDASKKEIWGLLAALGDSSDLWAAARWVMGRMYPCLLAHPERAREFTRFLENLWIDQGYETPDDLRWIGGVDDEFALAEQQIYGTVESATSELIANLAPNAQPPNKSGARVKSH